MSLRYNVSSLLGEPVGATREYDIEYRALIHEEEPAARDVSGHARFLRTNDGVLVYARVEGRETMECSRCLRPIEIPVPLDLEEQFFSTLDVRTGARLPEPDDPEAFRIDAQQTLDMEEAIRQLWMTALPMQPLCRPDCKGICPTCGRNLNEGECSCTPQLDERWSSLRELLGQRDRT